MNTSSTITRRDALLALGAFGATTAFPDSRRPRRRTKAPPSMSPSPTRPGSCLKGLDDRDPSRTDLRCEALQVTGRWPAELRGRFYRNGPALFERAGQRYHHWFDGDGMVQQFTFSGRGVSPRRQAGAHAHAGGRAEGRPLSHPPSARASRATRRRKARTRSTSPTPTPSSTPAGSWRCGKAARPTPLTRRTCRRSGR